MPKRKGNSDGLVGISIYVSLETLEKIQKSEGKTQSEKIRKLIEKGLARLTKGEGRETRLPPSIGEKL